MNFLLAFALTRVCLAQTIFEPIHFLHKRFTTKMDTNYLFPQVQYPPEPETCSSDGGIYCSLLNDLYSLTNPNIVRQRSQTRLLRRRSPSYYQWYILLNYVKMNDLVMEMESKRTQLIQQDALTLYEAGMRSILDEKLFYELGKELENQVPIKFVIDFNNFHLKSESQQFLKYYILDSDDKVIYTADEVDPETTKVSEVVCSFTNFILPPMEEVQKYIQYPRQLNGPQLLKFKQLQFSQLGSAYPPSEQYVVSTNNSVIQFSKPVFIHQFYVRHNKLGNAGQEIIISLYKDDNWIGDMHLDHKEKYNIWLSSKVITEPITRIEVPPNLQFDALLISYPQSPMTLTKSMKRIISVLRAIYQQIRLQDDISEIEKQFEIEFQQQMKEKSPTPQPQSTSHQDKPFKWLSRKEVYEKAKSEYTPGSFSHDGNEDLKTLEKTAGDDRELKNFQQEQIHDDVDVQALNLLINYVSRLYALIKESTTEGEVLNDASLKSLILQFEQSMTEKERTTYKQTTNMFLQNQYTVKEIKEMLTVLQTLGEMQSNTENLLTQTYQSNNEP